MVPVTLLLIVIVLGVIVADAIHRQDGPGILVSCVALASFGFMCLMFGGLI